CMTDEAIAPVVERIAELGVSGDRLESAADGIEAEPLLADRYRRTLLVRGHNGSAAIGADAVDLVVKAPVQVVQDGIGVVIGGEAGIDLLGDVGFAVAVGVLEIPDIGGRGHEYAALPAGDAAGRG